MSGFAPKATAAHAATRPDILLLVPAVPDFGARLAADFTVHDAPDDAALQAVLGQHASRIRAVVTMSKRPVDAALIDRLPALELIAVSGGHLDAIDCAHAAARGIRVSYTPGLSGPDVADLAFALMLNAARGIGRADRYVRAGRWKAEGPLPLMTRVSGARLGIYGLGYIGRLIAERASGFGMAVTYTARAAKPDAPWKFEADLTRLATASDFLVITSATTAETRGRVDAGVLKALGPEGILVNICRDIVNETALIEALQQGTIAGAAMDVFATEPEVPGAFLALDNVVLTSHIGSATNASRRAMADGTLENLQAHFAGRPLPSPAPDPAVLASHGH